MARKTPRQAAEAVIGRLIDAGHEALLAGGCVRDLLLGQEPEDYDVATSARPEEICSLYRRAQQVGAHFGVVIVRQYGHLVEVATFRTDGAYLDGRHPEEVTFASAEEDAWRRDFTINGMFLDVRSNQVIDYVDGQEDLCAGLVTAIGNPEQRFEEDHLRMLRAVRFASRLRFQIEQETFEAIYNRAAKITGVSKERVREELEKMLANANRCAGFAMLCDTGLLPHLWQDSQWSTARIGLAAKALAALPADAEFALALTTLLYPAERREVAQVCRALACSNKARRDCVWLAQSLAELADGSVRTLADLKLLMSGPCFADVVHLFEASLVAEGHECEAADELRRRAGSVPVHEVAPAPFVTGDDLHALQLPQGPQFKKILDRIYYGQLNNDVRNREQAMSWAREMVAQETGSGPAPA